MLLVGLIIYFVWKYISESKSKDSFLGVSSKNKNQYKYEMASEESFWDDFRNARENEKSNENKYPTREEEPVPPNAIPPENVNSGQSFEAMKVEEKVKPLDEPVQEVINEENK